MAEINDPLHISSLSPAVKHGFFMEIVNFPLIKSDIEIYPPLEYYVENDICNFSLCKIGLGNEDVKDRINKLHCLSFVESVIIELENNHKDYIPHKFDGIIISRAEDTLVYLKNGSITESSGRTIRFDYFPFLHKVFKYRIDEEANYWKIGYITRPIGYMCKQLGSRIRQIILYWLII